MTELASGQANDADAAVRAARKHSDWGRDSWQKSSKRLSRNQDGMRGSLDAKS